MAETEPDPVSASDEVDLSTEFNLAQLRRQSMEVSDGVSDIPETGMKQSLSHTNSLPGLCLISVTHCDISLRAFIATASYLYIFNKIDQIYLFFSHLLIIICPSLSRSIDQFHQIQHQGYQ